MTDARSTTFSSLFAEIEENAQTMRSLILAQIAEYAAQSPDDSDWIFTCASAVKDIDAKLTQLAQIRDGFVEVSENVLGFSTDTEETSAGRLRRIEIEVSEGMLNQSLLNLTAARRRGVVKLGETFKIRLPDNTEFETQLINPGNKLRERGWIREFYGKCEITAGQRVVLQEVEPGVWTLAPAPEPKVALD